MFFTGEINGTGVPSDFSACKYFKAEVSNRSGLMDERTVASIPVNVADVKLVYDFTLEAPIVIAL